MFNVANLRDILVDAEPKSKVVIDTDSILYENSFPIEGVTIEYTPESTIPVVRLKISLQYKSEGQSELDNETNNKD